MGMAVTSSIVFACVAGGAMLGLYLRHLLPPEQLNDRSREVIKLGMGLIGTMTALLLGMQIGSAKDTYDEADSKIKEMAANIGFLDRMMANYGPETREGREALRSMVAQAVDRVWSKRVASLPSPTEGGGEALYRQLHELSPNGPTQAAFKAEALSVAGQMARARWLMFAQSNSSGSAVFMTIVVIWLVVVFISFGLLGTPNVTVVVTLLVCALSVSGAIGLIMELNRPFGGIIQVSSEPLLHALDLMGK